MGRRGGGAQDDILSEVLLEIKEHEKKFKFCKDLKICKWDTHAFANPPVRLNLRTSTASVSLSQEDQRPVRQPATAGAPEHIPSTPKSTS